MKIAAFFSAVLIALLCIQPVQAMQANTTPRSGTVSTGSGVSRGGDAGGQKTSAPATVETSAPLPCGDEGGESQTGAPCGAPISGDSSPAAPPPGQ